MDLEVQVEGRPFGVAGVADEAEHGAGADLRVVERVRGVRREVRVVELVPPAVAEPETPAADLVPADGEDGAVRDGENRSAERREDVVAVVPGHVGPRGAERV